MVKNKLNLFSFSIFFLFFCNLFFGWGFQIFTISSIPINYIILIALFFFINIRVSFDILKHNKINNILFLFLLLNLMRLIYDFQKHGLIAIRDATYIIDIFFLLISAYFFSFKEMYDRFDKFLKICFFTVILYIIFWFLKDLVIIFSPIVTSPLGQDANLFFNWSTIAFFLLWFSFYKIIFTKKEQNFLNIFYLVFFILFSLIIFQRRFIYLGLISLFFISLFFKRDQTLKISIYFFLALLVLPIINYIGLSFEGKLGQVSNMFFFIDHLASAIPGYQGTDGKFEITSNTAEQRLEFWTYVLKNQLSNYYTLIFGNGYGSPIVSFTAIGNITVREPHNMYLTIFSRSGLVGFYLFILLNIKLINIWFQLYSTLKHKKNELHYKLLIFSGIYFVLIYVSGLVDSNLSYNYFSIIFNILWGLIISMNFLHIEGNKK